MLGIRPNILVGICISVIAILAGAGCSHNLYSKHYRELFDYSVMERSGELPPFEGEPTIHAVSNAYEESNRLHELGFTAIGASFFTAETQPDSDAVDHARKVKSERVVISKGYALMKDNEFYIPLPLPFPTGGNSDTGFDGPIGIIILPLFYNKKSVRLYRYTAYFLRRNISLQNR